MRRPPSSGSISARDGGRWLVRIDAGPDPITGERRRISRVVRGSKRDAQRLLDELRGQRGSDDGPDLALSALVERWRSTARHSAGTARNYDRAWRLVPEHLRTTAARSVTPSSLDQLYRALVRSGVSVHAVVTLHAMLSAAYAQAEKWWGMRSPTARATPPPVPRPQRNARGLAGFDPAALLAAAPTSQDRAWIAVHLVTGARRSEVLALRWSDLDRGTVTIAEALDPVGGGRKATKTGDVRRVGLDPTTVELVARWRADAVERARAAGCILGRDAYLFSLEPDSATPWRPDYATRRYARIARAAGVEGVTLHGLRHAMGSLLLDAGADPKTVQARLGHARSATTMDTYARALPARDAEAADVLGRIIHGG